MILPQAEAGRPLPNVKNKKETNALHRWCIATGHTDYCLCVAGPMAQAGIKTKIK